MGNGLKFAPTNVGGYELRLRAAKLCVGGLANELGVGLRRLTSAATKNDVVADVGPCGLFGMRDYVVKGCAD